MNLNQENKSFGTRLKQVNHEFKIIWSLLHVILICVMQDSNELFEIFIFGERLHITDGLSDRLISIDAQHLKKKNNTGKLYCPLTPQHNEVF